MNKCILRSIIMMLFFVGQNVFAAGETEPNNAFETADKITQGEAVTGNVGTSGDSYDFFVSTLKNEGTIKLYFSSTGLNEQADINFYVYSKNKSSIGAIAVNNKKSANDSLFIFCRADDTIYIRVNGSQSINYSFRYIVEEPAPNDVEPNNNFSEAVLISSNQLVKGRLGYSGTTSDNYDYFYSILPDDGTLRVYVDKVNTSNSADADFNLYVYNKNQGSIGSYSDNNKPVGELPTDTLDIFCVKGDTVYFRLNGSSGCFSYTMRYEMLSPPKGDIEPNNTFEEAVYIEEKEIVPGRIGYSNVGEDSYDYFYSVLPDDGTLRVYVDKVNTSNTANADFNLYVYNKKRGSIGSYSDNNTLVGELPTDTLDIFCVKGDTVYFRLNGGS
ncbi:MAG TPA: hypothetical protein VLZ75_12790, partial [Chitinophagales bacterium]|nr:hypothetical protein [Chitinophagales bacterium]